MTSPRTVVITRTALTLRIAVSPSYLRQHLGVMGATLGTDLANAVDAATREQRLGYFPALDYFIDQAGVNPALLTTTSNLARTVRDHVRREVQQHLAPFFSQIIIRRITSPAYTLPRVSPQQADALEALARHYFPDSVRLDLVVSSVERGPHVENPEQTATRRVLWNLRDYFERVEVTDARLLES